MRHDPKPTMSEVAMTPTTRIGTVSPLGVVRDVIVFAACRRWRPTNTNHKARFYVVASDKPYATSVSTPPPHHIVERKSNVLDLSATAE